MSGPTAPSWRTLYQNCPGIDGEESLFVLLQSPDEAPSGAGEVPLAWLFGSRRRIVVDATARRRLDLAKFNRAYISGSFPVTVTNRFKLTLTRR